MTKITKLTIIFILLHSGLEATPLRCERNLSKIISHFKTHLGTDQHIGEIVQQGYLTASSRLRKTNRSRETTHSEYYAIVYHKRILELAPPAEIQLLKETAFLYAFFEYESIEEVARFLKHDLKLEIGQDELLNLEQLTQFFYENFPYTWTKLNKAQSIQSIDFIKEIQNLALAMEKSQIFFHYLESNKGIFDVPKRRHALSQLIIEKWHVLPPNSKNKKAIIPSKWLKEKIADHQLLSDRGLNDEYHAASLAMHHLLLSRDHIHRIEFDRTSNTRSFRAYPYIDMLSLNFEFYQNESDSLALKITDQLIKRLQLAFHYLKNFQRQTHSPPNSNANELDDSLVPFFYPNIIQDLKEWEQNPYTNSRDLESLISTQQHLSLIRSRSKVNLSKKILQHLSELNTVEEKLLTLESQIAKLTDGKMRTKLQSQLHSQSHAHFQFSSIELNIEKALQEFQSASEQWVQFITNSRSGKSKVLMTESAELETLTLARLRLIILLKNSSYFLKFYELNPNTQSNELKIKAITAVIRLSLYLGQPKNILKMLDKLPIPLTEHSEPVKYKEAFFKRIVNEEIEKGLLINNELADIVFITNATPTIDLILKKIKHSKFIF